LLRFCPAIRHSPDRDSCERFCAVSVEANNRAVASAIAGNDQFFRPKQRNSQAFIGFSLLYIGHKFRSAAP
jgi:hypothetical protein